MNNLTNIFFDEKSYGLCGNKSYGSIIDNLSDYSDNKESTYRTHMGNEGDWRSEYIRVPIEFINKFPELSNEKIQKHYNKYLSTLRSVLLKRMPYVNSNYIHVSLKDIGDICGSFQYKNERYYIFDEFRDIKPFFYAPPDKKGNGHKKANNNYEKNSEVYIFNQKLIDLLIDTGDAKELVGIYYGELTNKTIETLETIPVDIKSLNGYIYNTQLEIEKVNKNSTHEAKLYRNLRQAKYIRIISEYFYSAYNCYVLPQIPQLSPYGRMYYKGINVQNISKEVRSAVLGDYYSYDLNAAVYAIKLMLAKRILKQQGVSDYGLYTYTKEYLDKKSAIRKKLGQHIKRYPKPEKLVKEAINAIGFGARISGGSWLIDGQWHTTSIEDIIMNPTDRHNFMNDPWIKNFVKEQQQMTEYIAKYYVDDEFINEVKDVPNMFGKNNRPRRTQVMSYVFQHTEKAIMDIITTDLPIIARVHDSFITKHKLTNEQLLSIKYKLNDIEPLMTLDCESHHGWINMEHYDDENDIDEAFSRLTGLQHTKPNIVIDYKPIKKQTEFYDSNTLYEQKEYDEYDPFTYQDGLD